MQSLEIILVCQLFTTTPFVLMFYLTLLEEKLEKLTENEEMSLSAVGS